MWTPSTVGGLLMAPCLLSHTFFQIRGLTQIPAHLTGALTLCLAFAALFLGDQTLNLVSPSIAWIQPEQTDLWHHDVALYMIQSSCLLYGGASVFFFMLD